MTANELEERISIIRNELELLIEEIDEQVPVGDGPDDGRPDTYRLMEVHYAMGNPTGLVVALSALPARFYDAEDRTGPDQFQQALDPPEMQRTRQAEWLAKLAGNPALAEFVAAAKASASRT